MNAADLEPVPDDQKTQSPLDLFLIFAGANVVATTFITGATVKSGLSFQSTILAIISGSIIGALLVALLAPVGSRWGTPSIIALRAPLGRPGAHVVAAILYLSNFAWIALNNVIAASVTEAVFPSADMRLLAVVLGIAATLLVAGGPRLVALANRLAVPLMVVSGAVLAWLALGALGSVPDTEPSGAGISMWLALDLVIAYQVSWILMFADYSRYSASPVKSGVAVFASLSVISILGMLLGALLCAVSGSTDPGAMLAAVGSPLLGALLLATATITTNFVNIYLSALALRSLIPAIKDGPAIVVTGLIGAALSVLSKAWIDGYAGFMGTLGMILVPLGGVALAQFYPFPEIEPRELYHDAGRFARPGWAGVAAWAAGAAVYWNYQSTGSTLPALLVSFAMFAALRRLKGGRAPRSLSTDEGSSVEARRRRT